MDARRAVIEKLRDPSVEPPVSDIQRPLYFELLQGIARERLFLDYASKPHVEQKPRPRARDLLHLALYQGLFLEDVPQYAIFSSLKEPAQAVGVSDAELRFIYAATKATLARRDQILAERKEVLSDAAAGLKDGRKHSQELLSAVLNLPTEVLSDLADAAKADDGRSAKAWTAAAAWKERASLVGYALTPQGQTELTPLNSSLAPEAGVFQSAAHMRKLLSSADAWVQGEASQWACAQVVQWISTRAQGLAAGKKLRILEMAAGKGGKTLRTLITLERDMPDIVEYLHWVLSDTSVSRIRLFESGAWAHLQRVGVRVETRVWNWLESGITEGDEGAWDLVWLDAPCSGLGTLAKHPEIAARVNAKAIADLAALQASMLDIAARLVAPKGALYFTLCTLSKTETILGSKMFHERNPGFKKIWARALWPGAGELKSADGFFGLWSERQE